MHNPMHKSICTACLSCLALLCCSCASRVTKSDDAPGASNQRRPDAQRSVVARQTTDPVFPRLQDPDALKEGWNLFIADGEYRLARPDDFSDPVRRRIDVRGGIYLPLLFDINNDQGYDDYAVIVVDAKKDEATRFGLVIFSAPAGGMAPFKPSWVFRDRDLSRVALSRASGRLVVTQYLDDGSEKSCFVHWHTKERRYSCD
jgi:hypothetical protein